MHQDLDIRKVISLGILFAFLLNTFGPLPLAQAQDFRLPAPGVMVHLSPEFTPPILKGIKVHPDNPFRFDFILDKGDSQLSNDALKDESRKLIKYFLASLTIPEKDLWVNLSPYEKDRIIPRSFGLTEMGRDLLAEDYMLKQITASLIYPESEVGKKFWKRVYEEAYKKYGTTNIPVNTFNKVWIVPEKAVVYENVRAETAYVVESRLKVMLEQDYLSLEKHAAISSSDISSLGSTIVREIVIPQLTKEVNEDKNFAQLRQVYNSLILATWYKKKIQDSILGQVFEDKNKIQGLALTRRDSANGIQGIYQRYLQAFKKGVYNYIKADVDPVTQQPLPRKYFSGGASLAMTAMGPHAVFRIIDFAEIANPDKDSQEEITLDLAMGADDQEADAATALVRFTPIPEHGKILAFGTSSTKGVPDRTHSFPVLLGKMLSGHEVINRGVSAERIVNVGHRNETRKKDGISRLPEDLDTYHPSLLILWHGRTDWMDGKSDIEVENGLKRMIDEAKRRDCQVLLLGTFKFHGNEDADADVYGKVARETNTPYLRDIEQGITKNAELLFDPIHPNAEGNLLIAKRIAGFLWDRGALDRKPDISLIVPPSSRVVFQESGSPRIEDPQSHVYSQSVGPEGLVHFKVGFGNATGAYIKADQVSLVLILRYRGEEWSNEYVRAVVDKDYKYGYFRFKAILPFGVEEYTFKVSCDGKPDADKTKTWVWSNQNTIVHRTRGPQSFHFDPRLALMGGASSEGPRLNALPAGATILMYGSSSVYGPGVEPHLSPPAFLQEITGYHVINAGVSGERLFNLPGNPYNRDTEGVSRLAGELDRYHPSLVILWHGRNDWFDGKDDVVVKAALLKMIDTANGRKVPVLLLGAPKSGETQDAIVYKQVAEERGIPYLPGMMKGVLSNKDLMHPEDIHANADGNFLFAQRIFEFLRVHGALSVPPSATVTIPRTAVVDFQKFDPPIFEDVQHVGSDGAIYFTAGFGQNVTSDHVTARLHYEIPDDPQGQWQDDNVNAEIVNDFGFGYFRFKAILPPGVKAYHH